jgi:hypothetical protein
VQPGMYISLPHPNLLLQVELKNKKLVWWTAQQMAQSKTMRLIHLITSKILMQMSDESTECVIQENTTTTTREVSWVQKGAGNGSTSDP